MADSTTIRISIDLKEELDNLMQPSENYTNLIYRLLKEIKDLEKINENLKYDKDQLYKIALRTSDSVAFPNNLHRATYVITRVIEDGSINDAQKLEDLKTYLSEMLEDAPDDIIATIGNLKEMLELDSIDVPDVLIEFENYVKDSTS